MNNKRIFTIIFFAFFIFISAYISWIFAVFSIIFSLLFYSFLTYIFYYLYQKIYVKEYIFFNLINYKNYFELFLDKLSKSICILMIMIWWFSYYQNEISPAIMPVYTITNWDKVIVFHTMSHIWTKTFYENVKNNIINFKKQDYVYYFEWVWPWSKESEEKFNKALWIKFDKNTYAIMSKLYWLVNQNNSIFLNLVNNKDINVDVNIDDIIKNYDNLKIKNGNQNKVYNEVLDVNKELNKELEKLNNKELEILRYVNKAFINLIVKNKNLQDIIQSNFANKELFEVILNKRNEIIAEKFINSSDKKIIATYWMLHFEWIFNILKENDIKWRISKIDYLYPIK